MYFSGSISLVRNLFHDSSLTFKNSALISSQASLPRFGGFLLILVIVLVLFLWLGVFLRELLRPAWITISLALSRLSENVFVQKGFESSHSGRPLSLFLILVVSQLSEDIYVQRLFRSSWLLISLAFFSLQLSGSSIGIYVQRLFWISLRMGSSAPLSSLTVPQTGWRWRWGWRWGWWWPGWKRTWSASRPSGYSL